MGDSMKAFGQHNIKNPSIVRDILNDASIKTSDTVLEIGSGTGNMTKELVKRAKRVIAVELDPNKILILKRRLRTSQYSSKVTLIHADVLQIDLPFFDVCLANIPYQISSPFTFKLLTQRPLFRVALIMYQHEFARRMIANPGDSYYCRLSSNVQLLSRVKLLFNVDKIHFSPSPTVDSSVLRLEPKDPQPMVNLTEWDALTRLCFARKNKTLWSAFRRKITHCTLRQNYDLHRHVYLRACTNKTLRQSIPGQSYKNASTLQAKFKDFVCSVLKDHGFHLMRSLSMTEADFFRLLVTMNTRGIYFAKAWQIT